jgi:hypothetical protein
MFCVALLLYDKLSNLSPSDMSDRSVRHVQGIRFSCIRAIILDIRTIISGTQSIVSVTRPIVPGTRLIIPGTQIIVPGTQTIVSQALR